MKPLDFSQFGVHGAIVHVLMSTTKCETDSALGQFLSCRPKQKSSENLGPVSPHVLPSV